MIASLAAGAAFAGGVIILGFLALSAYAVWQVAAAAIQRKRRLRARIAELQAAGVELQRREIRVWPGDDFDDQGAL